MQIRRLCRKRVTTYCSVGIHISTDISTIIVNYTVIRILVNFQPPPELHSDRFGGFLFGLLLLLLFSSLLL